MIAIWRGFKLKELNIETFYSKLGFENIPYEVTLVFYESIVYQHTFKTTTGRAYGLLSSAIFDFHEDASKTAFPILLNERTEWEQPYYLFEDCPNWKAGKTKVLVSAQFSK